MMPVVRSVRRVLRRTAMFPISPRLFRAFVAALRFVNILPGPTRKRVDQIKTIFVSHPYSSVGDLVLLLPLLERIKKEWPDAEIDIVVGSNACDLLAETEGIRNKFVCGSHRTRIAIIGDYIRLLRYLRLYRKAIMRFEYDVAIAPRWGSVITSDAIYFAYLTGAPERIGYSSSVDGGDPAMDSLLTRAVSGGWHEHETSRNLMLLDRAGLTGRGAGFEPAVDRTIPSILNLAHRGSLQRKAQVQIPWLSTPPPQYAVVSPGATNPFNIWPIDKFAEVICALHELRGFHFLVVGSSSDTTLCDELAQRSPAYAKSLAGKTDLQQVVQFLSDAVLFIGMDSGIAHIAGPLGIPSVILSPFPSSQHDEHPCSPIRFRPCGPHVLVLQPFKALPPCSPTCAFPGPHCITQIKAQDVVLAAMGLLGDKGAFTRPEQGG